MKRRGKCRCGAILLFSPTSQGYKTRCAGCGSVVRLRVEDAGRAKAKPAKKSPSAALVAVGPPPLPEAEFSAPSLTPAPDGEPDFAAFSDHESTAPKALAEMAVYSGPARKRPTYLPWIVFGALAALVVLGVGVAAMMWG